MTPLVAPSGIGVIAGGAALAIDATDARSAVAARAFSVDFMDPLLNVVPSTAVRPADSRREKSNADIAAKFRLRRIQEPMFIRL